MTHRTWSLLVAAPLLCGLGLVSCSDDEDSGDGDAVGGDGQGLGGTSDVPGTGGAPSSSANLGGTGALLDLPSTSEGTGGGSGAGNGDEDVCDALDFEITGRIVDMLIVLDRSASMEESGLWLPMGRALTEVTALTEEGINFGLLTFPFTNEECAPGDILIDVGARNAAAIANVVGGGINDVGTAIGTPTAASLRLAKTYLDSIDDGLDKFVLLANDGAPNCNDALDNTTCRCSVENSFPAFPPIGFPTTGTGGGAGVTPPGGTGGVTGMGVGGSTGVGGNADGPAATTCAYGWWCLDDADTVTAASELYSAGYPVYVLGIGDSMQWDDVMNSIAQAGGTAEYIPADSDNFAAVLMDIIGGVLSCDFDVDWNALAQDVEHDRNLVNLYCKQDGSEANNDDLSSGNIIASNPECAAGGVGWTWSDASTITMCNETCSAIKRGDCPVISATFGCHTVEIKVQ